MKKFALLLLIIPLIGISQETKTQHNNFKLQEDKTLIWQKIYPINVGKDNIIDSLKLFLSSQSFTREIYLEEDKFIGRVCKMKASNVKGLSIMARQNFDIFVKIDIKQNAYRVTIKDVKFDPIDVGVSSGGISVSSPVTSTLSELSVRTNHNEIRKNKTSRTLLTILDKDFEKYFTITNQKKDDW